MYILYPRLPIAIAERLRCPDSPPCPQLKTTIRRHPDLCQQARISQGPVHPAVRRDIAEHMAGDNFQAMAGKTREMPATGFQTAMDGIVQSQTETAEFMV